MSIGAHFDPAKTHPFNGEVKILENHLLDVRRDEQPATPRKRIPSTVRLKFRGPHSFMRDVPIGVHFDPAKTHPFNGEVKILENHLLDVRRDEHPATPRKRISSTVRLNFGVLNRS